MIPKKNVADLMLREDVLEAVRKKKFQIYAVSTVDEGIEILTGRKAGGQRSDGSYEPGSVFHRVDGKLRLYAEQWRKFEGGND